MFKKAEPVILPFVPVPVFAAVPHLQNTEIQLIAEPITGQTIIDAVAQCNKENTYHKVVPEQVVMARLQFGMIGHNVHIVAVRESVPVFVLLELLIPP